MGSSVCLFRSRRGRRPRRRRRGAGRQGRQPGRNVPPRPAGSRRLHHLDHRQRPGRAPPAGCRRTVLEGIDQALARVERAIGRRYGDPANPLLLSVRSGARRSMPGMMETVLDLGLNRATVQGLATASGDARFAWDAYRRLLVMYSDVVLEKAAGADTSRPPRRARAARGAAAGDQERAGGHQRPRDRRGGARRALRPLRRTHRRGAAAAACRRIPGSS